MSLVDGLNPMQKQAVLQTDGAVLILAGAGSGKTRVLTHRIAYLIEKGVLPQNILAITFTNKAAKEMRERVDNLVGKGAEDIWVSTFHSACVRILRRDIDKLGYDRSFVIYDMDDQKKLMQECLKQLNVDEKQFPARGVLGEISSAKDELIGVGEYEKQNRGDFRKAKIAEAYALYQKKLKKNNALDFDDIIFRTVELFRLRPDVLQFYQNRFQYIMVDEYQDTNTAQYQLIHLLASKYQNLCVVGDDDQSIYKFRGANIRNILDFEKDFPNTLVIKLEQNYRCSKKILEAANQVIKNNRGRKSKTLWTENEEGTAIHTYNAQSEYEEAKFIADEIVHQIEEEGREYGDFAILYRTNAQSRVLEEKLLQNNIPYRLFGGVRFYERKEIKDILAYLKTISNPSDDIAVKRIINVPKRGIGQTTVSKVTEYATYTEDDFFNVLTYANEIPSLQRPAKKLKDFANFIISMQIQLEAIGVVDLIEMILEQTGYMKELKLEKTEESQGRIDNLNELISKAAEYEHSNAEPSLSGFLEEVSLVADIDNYEENTNAVVLMTLHSAKGLEFPYVFISGLEEGLFPSYMSMVSGDEKDLEEERRLCYVGITRAQQALYLTCAKSRMIRGVTQYSAPSRFLEEVPEELLKDHKVVVSTICSPKVTPIHSVNKLKSTVNKNPYTTQKVKREIPSPKNIKLDFVEGELVQHKKFGVGSVLKIDPAGADYEVTIHFPKFGIKKLMAAFSNLKKVGI